MRNIHLVLAVSLVSATAFAGHKQDAKKHVDKAMKAHAEGKFDIALTELRAAYKLDPQPDLLYAMGQVYSKLGRCTDATASFEKFRTAKKKDPAITKVVDDAIAACKVTDSPFQDTHAAEPGKPDAGTTEPAKVEPAKIEPAKVEPAKVEPVKVEPAAVETPPKQEPPKVETPAKVEEPPKLEEPLPARPMPAPQSASHPWYSDALGDALVVGGLVAAVGAGVEYKGARGSIDDASNAMTLDQYNKAVDDAHSKRTYSLILGGAGAALIGAGLIHYMIHGKHAETHGVAIVPTGDGGLITWTGGL